MVRKKLTERDLGKLKLGMLIEYYLGDMKRRGCTEDSIYGNRMALNRFAKFLANGLKDVTLDEATDDSLDDYISGMQNRKLKYRDHPFRKPERGKLSPFTIRKEIKILKGFGTWLDREGFENSFTDLPVPKEPKRLVKALTDDEIDQVIASINPHTEIGSRLYAMVIFMLDSGPRISEVVNARLPELDLETRQIRIVGKGDKERIVPFGSRCSKAFLNYIHLHRPEPVVARHNRVFLSMDGAPMTRNSLQSVFTRLKRSSGVPRVHGHLFRHTFAVKYLMNGGDLVTLQRILGHESLEVTKRYLDLTTAQVQVRYDEFSPVDRLPLSGLRRFGNKRKT